MIFICISLQNYLFTFISLELNFLLCPWKTFYTHTQRDHCLLWKTFFSPCKKQLELDDSTEDKVFFSGNFTWKEYIKNWDIKGVCIFFFYIIIQGYMCYFISYVDNIMLVLFIAVTSWRPSFYEIHKQPGIAWLCFPSKHIFAAFCYYFLLMDYIFQSYFLMRCMQLCHQ